MEEALAKRPWGDFDERCFDDGGFDDRSLTRRLHEIGSNGGGRDGEGCDGGNADEGIDKVELRDELKGLSGDKAVGSFGDDTLSSKM